jgi:hypothetical protein
MCTSLSNAVFLFLCNCLSSELFIGRSRESLYCGFQDNNVSWWLVHWVAKEAGNHYTCRFECVFLFDEVKACYSFDDYSKLFDYADSDMCFFS